MTDFFADLEQEIRAAHPRRSRPVVPIRPVALALAALAAVLTLASLVPTGEQEAVQQPPPAQEGWTGYGPADCSGEGAVVDGTIPDEIVDRFAILRADVEPVTLPNDEVPYGIAEVVRQSLRPLLGPGKRKYLFAVARLADERCEPGAVAVCLIAIQAADFACEIPSERPLLAWWSHHDGEDRVVAILADDAVRRAEVRVGDLGEVVEPGDGDDPNVAFLVLRAGGTADVTVTDVTP